MQLVTRQYAVPAHDIYSLKPGSSKSRDGRRKEEGEGDDDDDEMANLSSSSIFLFRLFVSFCFTFFVSFYLYRGARWDDDDDDGQGEEGVSESERRGFSRPIDHPCHPCPGPKGRLSCFFFFDSLFHLLIFPPCPYGRNLSAGSPPIR